MYAIFTVYVCFGPPRCGVRGHQTKMSASVASTALYMTDTEKILGP